MVWHMNIVYLLSESRTPETRKGLRPNAKG